MSLYPTLEDMKVSQLQQAQDQMYPPFAHQAAASMDQFAMPPSYNVSDYTFAAGAHRAGDNQVVASTQPSAGGSFYPSVEDYMGLSLQKYQNNSQVAARPVVSAPVSAQNWAGIKRSVIHPGVSEVVLCHDAKGRVGLKFRDLNKGVFVQYVAEDSPASMAGVRFGDQILTVNDEVVAGYSADKVHKLVKKAGPNNIRLAVRDRPFERIISLTKGSGGLTGFGYVDGKITTIVKDSSAARNGMLTEHQIVEVNGRNVIGLKDKEISKLISDCGDVVTITLMPSEIYQHMIKKIGSLIKSMDHTVPDC